jgi:hypothetical protein
MPRAAKQLTELPKLKAIIRRSYGSASGQTGEPSITSEPAVTAWFRDSEGKPAGSGPGGTCAGLSPPEQVTDINCAPADFPAALQLVSISAPCRTAESQSRSTTVQHWTTSGADSLVCLPRLSHAASSSSNASD